MNIIEFSNMTKMDLDVVYVPTKRKWLTCFDCAELVNDKDNGTSEVYGEGDTKEESIRDYAKKIAGKVITEHVRHQAYLVPDDLTD